MYHEPAMKMCLRTFFLLSCGYIALMAVPVHVLAFTVPPNDGFVTDTADVLTAQQAEDMEAMLRAYSQQTSNEIAILIVESLQDASIADAAVQVGREWGVGTAQDDNGILILMSYADREVFLATGYGLEGAVPDLVARGVIEQDILPRFRDGEYYEGLMSGIEALQKHIGGEYTAERYAAGNGSPSLPIGFLIIVGLLFAEALASFLGRSKSWWLGGVLGVVAGIVLVMLFGWWLSIPLLAVAGLFLDYLASRFYTPAHRKRAGRRTTFLGGGGFGGRGGGGGGFGGFGGGSFGGGGAGGRW